jgi:hypothetical protein
MALWTPAEITTAMWFDADDGDSLTLDGSAIDEWGDKSGNNRDAAATGALRPALASSVLNGKNVVRFDGSNILRTGSDEWHNGQWSAFVVGRGAEGETSGQFVAQDRSFPPRVRIAQYLRLSDGYLTSVAFSGVSGSYSVFAIDVTDEDPEQWHVFGVTRSTALLSAHITGNPKGTEDLSGTPSNDGAPLCIGARETSADAFAEYLDGDIAEIVLISGVVASEDRESIEGYLAHKWGLEESLPAEHPYKDSAPGSDPEELLFPPTNLNFSNVTQTNMRLNWTAPS